MVEVELELTYLARELPKDLAAHPSKLIADIYYPASDAHPTLRVRQRGEVYEITKKLTADGKDSSHQFEHTIPLTKEEFEAITAGSGGKRVVKRRYLYPYQGLTAEVDVFQGDLRGLVEIDFEFTDRDTQLTFEVPEFCLADVTQEAFAAGGKLAGKSYADIQSHLDLYGYRPLFLERQP